ncbi:MAG TPA: homoserine O-succinyltransferase [Xanthobacteraceae bacterium]|nr:homoserine O-succinyltransferase [Xanthobacteraceae bacterium]
MVGDAVLLPRHTLRVGLANLMPDAALEATERHFLGLVAAAVSEFDIQVTLIEVAGVNRGSAGAEHMARYYMPVSAIDHPLDALIVTGTAPTQTDLRRERFWNGLVALFDWASRAVSSTFCSCLAAHAAVLHFHGIERVAQRRWGVFEHGLVELDAPLMTQLPRCLLTPHSRYFGLERNDLIAAGLRVIVDGEHVGPHLFTSTDGRSFVFSQGHPEYSARTLLREFLRDTRRAFDTGAQIPQPPSSYFPEWVNRRIVQLRSGPPGSITVHDLAFLSANEMDLAAPWRDAAIQLFRNWLLEVTRPRTQQSDKWFEGRRASSNDQGTQNERERRQAVPQHPRPD